MAAGRLTVKILDRKGEGGPVSLINLRRGNGLGLALAST